MVLETTATVAGKSLAGTAAKRFGSAVVERWTRYRAQRFFEGFVEAIGLEHSNGLDDPIVDEKLDEILADEVKSEALFDAYRRVCFSKSKKLGPRIIGLLTGQIVAEGRMANDGDESIFAAAESLSDGEFIEFMKSYHEHRKKADGITDEKAKHHMSGGSVVVRWCEDHDDGSFGHHAFDIGPFPWDDALGQWAVTLRRCGFLEERVQQIRQMVRFRDMEDSTPVTTVATTVEFYPDCSRLYDLVSRSLGPNQSVTGA